MAKRHHFELRAHYAALYPDSAEKEFELPEWQFADAEDLEALIQKRKDELDAQRRKEREEAQRRIDELQAQKEAERKATEAKIKEQEDALQAELERREKALQDFAAAQTKKRLEAEERSRKTRVVGDEEKQLIITQFKENLLVAEAGLKNEVSRQNKKFLEKRKKQ